MSARNSWSTRLRDACGPVTGAVAPVEQLQVAIPEVVATAGVGEVERAAGVADQRGRAQVGAPVEPAVAVPTAAMKSSMDVAYSMRST